MTPNKAQRVWHSLSTKWLMAVPYNPVPYPRRSLGMRKVKKGILTNFIPVEVVNAVTGEIAHGYMRDASKRKLKQWLGFHNHSAQVEEVNLSPKTTLFHLSSNDIKEGFPVLIKLGKYQVPYLVHAIHKQPHANPKIKKQLFTLDLKTVDNLKYLELVVKYRPKAKTILDKIKAERKKTRKKVVKSTKKKKR